MVAEQIGQLWHEPALVPRLDGDGHRASERPQRVVQSVQVDLEAGWQLQEHDPELVAKLHGALHQELDRPLRILEPLDVRQVAAGLDREPEVVGHRVAPAPERLRLRHPVEGDVELDRIECARTMSKQPARASDHDPYGWRTGAVRVIANALLVLLAYEIVSLAFGVVQMIVAGPPPPPPLPPAQMVLLAAVFLLVRWIFVLPGLLVVLVGLEYVTRRVPHGRVLTAIVAFAPMVLWELTQSGDTSAQGAVLGATAVLFAVLARLPARFHERSTNDPGAMQPPAETVVAPR